MPAQKAVVQLSGGGEGTGCFVGHAPLSRITMREIIETGLILSCYDPTPDGVPRGRFDARLVRAKGFAEAGAPDPALAAALR
jgi:7-cyano-7-deazaguanine synthase